METIERYRSELLSPDGLDYKPLATHPERATILFELLRPYGFQRPVVEELSKHLAEGTAGAKFYSPTHLLIHGAQLLELLPHEEVAAVSLSIDISQDGQCALPSGEELHWELLPLSTLKGSYRTPREVALFDYDKLRSKMLTIRSRREGDALRPFGMSGKKLLRRILIDGKFSHRARREALLLCREEAPIWLIGHVADRTFALSDKTQTVLRFTYHK